MEEFELGQHFAEGLKDWITGVVLILGIFGIIIAIKDPAKLKEFIGRLVKKD